MRSPKRRLPQRARKMGTRRWNDVAEKSRVLTAEDAGECAEEGEKSEFLDTSLRLRSGRVSPLCGCGKCSPWERRMLRT
jgi:hypothetical protein